MKDSNMRKTPQQIAQALFSLLFIPASLITETGREQQPVMFMLGTDGKPEIMPLAGRVDGPEDAMRFHRYLAQQSDVAASCLISEAYVAKLPIDDPRCAEVMSGKLRPQDVEDRGEEMTGKKFKRTQLLEAANALAEKYAPIEQQLIEKGKRQP